MTIPTGAYAEISNPLRDEIPIVYVKSKNILEG
jgi:hypothetical protein